MNILDFLDLVREKHEPESEAIGSGDYLSEYEYGCLDEDEE